jgi:hypothetical protein
MATGGGQVLATVSKVLSMLKLHLTRVSVKDPNSFPNNTSITEHVDLNSHSKSEKNSTSPLRRITSASNIVDRLTVEVQLKEGENRQLREELYKKDQMLSMLTEGLKEVLSYFVVCHRHITLSY